MLESAKSKNLNWIFAKRGHGNENGFHTVESLGKYQKTLQWHFEVIFRNSVL